MTTNPCLDCEFRHVGCHAECVPYKDWKQEQYEAKKSLLPHRADQFLSEQCRRVKKKTHKQNGG